MERRSKRDSDDDRKVAAVEEVDSDDDRKVAAVEEEDSDEWFDLKHIIQWMNKNVAFIFLMDAMGSHALKKFSIYCGSGGGWGKSKREDLCRIVHKVCPDPSEEPGKCSFIAEWTKLNPIAAADDVLNAKMKKDRWEEIERAGGVDENTVIQEELVRLNEKVVQETLAHPALSPVREGVSAVDHVKAHCQELKKLALSKSDGKFVNTVLELCAYHILHGHCNVPMIAAGSQYNKLGRQCQHFKNMKKGMKSGLIWGESHKWMIEILEAIGFSWSSHDDEWSRNMAKLDNYVKAHGTGYVAEAHDSSDLPFVQWAKRIRQAYHANNRKIPGVPTLTDERIRQLKEAHFDFNERKHQVDEDRVKELREYFEQEGHSHVPYPDRTLVVNWHSLYVWTCKMRERYPDEVDTKIIEKMDDLNFDWYHPTHFKDEERVEIMIYDHLERVCDIKIQRRDLPFVPTDQLRRRPDAVILSTTYNGLRIIIFGENDECLHNMESIEKEQRKQYLNITYAIREGYHAIHYVRVNSAQRYFIHLDQQSSHAAIIKKILADESRPEDGKFEVTMHILDYPSDHHHVNANRDRLMPKDDETVRAEAEEDWDKKPIFDHLKLYESGAGKGG